VYSRRLCRRAFISPTNSSNVETDRVLLDLPSKSPTESFARPFQYKTSTSCSARVDYSSSYTVDIPSLHPPVLDLAIQPYVSQSVIVVCYLLVQGSVHRTNVSFASLETPQSLVRIRTCLVSAMHTTIPLANDIVQHTLLRMNIGRCISFSETCEHVEL